METIKLYKKMTHELVTSVQVFTQLVHFSVQQETIDENYNENTSTILIFTQTSTKGNKRRIYIYYYLLKKS